MNGKSPKFIIHYSRNEINSISPIGWIALAIEGVGTPFPTFCVAFVSIQFFKFI